MNKCINNCLSLSIKSSKYNTNGKLITSDILSVVTSKKPFFAVIKWYEKHYRTDNTVTSITVMWRGRRFLFFFFKYVSYFCIGNKTLEMKMWMYQFSFLLSVTTPDHSTLEKKMFLAFGSGRDRVHDSESPWQWEWEFSFTWNPPPGSRVRCWWIHRWCLPFFLFIQRFLPRELCH